MMARRQTDRFVKKRSFSALINHLIGFSTARLLIMAITVLLGTDIHCLH